MQQQLIKFSDMLTINEMLSSFVFKQLLNVLRFKFREGSAVSPR